MTAAIRLLTKHRWLPLDELTALGARLAEVDLFVLARCGEPVSVLDVDTEWPLSRELMALAPPGRRWQEACEAARDLQSLHLDAAADGMGIASRVWVISGSLWLREVANLGRDMHVRALRSLIETNAVAQPPPRDAWRVWTAFHHISQGERRETDLHWIIKGIQRGASPGYLASTMRVAKACNQGDVVGFCEAPKARVCLSSHFFIWLIGATCLYCAKKAWKASSLVPELQEALVQMKSVQLPNWAMHDLMRSLTHLYRLKARQPSMPVNDLRRLTTVIVSKVRRLGSTMGADWITALESLFVSRMLKTVAGFEAAIQFNDKLHRVVGDDAADVSTVIGALINARGEEDLRLVLALDDHWCKRVAKLASSQMRRGQACDGIAQLGGQGMELLWAACQRLPAQWFQVMRQVCGVPKSRTKVLLNSAAEHPLFACPLRLDEPRLALVMIDSVRDERCRTNPVTERLRDHAAGKRALPAHLLEHDLALLHRGWLEAQLHLMDELIQAEVWRAFPGLKEKSGITIHSLKMALDMDHNRRPLRRLLQRCARGEADGQESHPTNQHWQRSLGDLCAQRWREGFATTRLLPGLGEVTISLENDPQEVLRMGSAVGSCLSVGGLCSYSAAANALDANKRVLFARTADGRVVGRQLLAISEEKRLVCFSPYPLSLSDALAEFFADYDQVLASYLGLPLHCTGDYTIKRLVAKEWYDDGPWSRMLFAA